MVPKNYIVKLLVCIAGYEKITTQLIEAEDEEQATQLALEGESHNGDDAGYNEHNEWHDDNFEYSLSSIVEVPWDDAVTLRKYL